MGDFDFEFEFFCLVDFFINSDIHNTPNGRLFILNFLHTKSLLCEILLTYFIKAGASFMMVTWLLVRDGGSVRESSYWGFSFTISLFCR